MRQALTVIHLQKALAVEGKYDKIRLEAVTDATVVVLNGFGIYNDPELLAYLRRLAETQGLIILTDSDAAGFQLRAFLTGCLPADRLFHAYIPDVAGKEKRKAAPSKEGKLGVEGIQTALLEEILAPFACDKQPDLQALTKADLFEDGLVGRPDSAERRRRFAALAGLPTRIGANALLRFVNRQMTRPYYLEILAKSD